MSPIESGVVKLWSTVNFFITLSTYCTQIIHFYLFFFSLLVMHLCIHHLYFTRYCFTVLNLILFMWTILCIIPFWVKSWPTGFWSFFVVLLQQSSFFVFITPKVPESPLLFLILIYISVSTSTCTQLTLFLYWISVKGGSHEATIVCLSVCFSVKTFSWLVFSVFFLLVLLFFCMIVDNCKI